MQKSQFITKCLVVIFNSSIYEIELLIDFYNSVASQAFSSLYLSIFHTHLTVFDSYRIHIKFKRMIYKVTFSRVA